MKFELIVIFAIFQTIEVLSMNDSYECVKRKSGVCKAFNITEDFDSFIKLNENGLRISLIIEIDYIQNKYSYVHDKNKKRKEFDTVNNPVVELLFSEDKDPQYSYRVVLGEKLNRLAYVDVEEFGASINYNNYSPDLPAWPFAINVTIDRRGLYHTYLSVYTKNGDGFDKDTPFLEANSNYIAARYMAVRSRNDNVKLIGFYDCRTDYGSYCGVEEAKLFRECREKFSPFGSGTFSNFVDMSRFNRLAGKGKEYDEVFGIYRHNDDNMHILFSDSRKETGTYIRITIGDGITARVRTLNRRTYEYYEKTTLKNGFNHQPSQPNFIRIKISSKTKDLSIHDLLTNTPMLTMKLCNFFDHSDVTFMSVTSDRFKSVELYYDCCLYDDCHVYEKKYSRSKRVRSTTESTELTSETAIEATSGTTSEAFGGTTSEGTSATTSEATSGTTSKATSGTTSEAFGGTTSEGTSATTSEATSGTTSKATSGTTRETTTSETTRETTTTETTSETNSEASSVTTSEATSGTISEATSGTTSKATSGTTRETTTSETTKETTTTETNSEASSGTTSEATSGTTSEAFGGTTSEAFGGTTTDGTSGMTSEATQYDRIAGIRELKTLNNVDKKVTFLNTLNFHPTDDVIYEYQSGISTSDYCPEEITHVEFIHIVPADYSEDEDNSHVRGGLSPAILRTLIG